MKIKHKFDKNNLFFTSDTHFYHKNVAEYCNRPFLYDIEAHNNMLIGKWNKVVAPVDDIIIAGDFAFLSNLEKLEELLDSLNGRKWLTLGNHDYQNKMERESAIKLFRCVADAFDFTVEDDEIEDGYLKFHVQHYPCEFWTRGAIHLHGHVHSGPRSAAGERTVFKPKRYDIGVDNNNYSPISYHQVKVIITKQLLGYECT